MRITLFYVLLRIAVTSPDVPKQLKEKLALLLRLFNPQKGVAFAFQFFCLRSIPDYF